MALAAARQHTQPMNAQYFRFDIEPAMAGGRADKALAERLPGVSRAAVQRWFKRGLVRVDGRAVAQKHRLAGGEVLEVDAPVAETATGVDEQAAQAVALDIIDADADIIVINKPAGQVVHPGAGNPDRTLLNGLLHFDESLRALPRAGIVHRLDKDTSGLLVVARNETARLNLIAQLAARTVKRGYLAVANGVPVAGERIDQPLGRDPRDRRRMQVVADANKGRAAVTHVRVERKFRRHCLLRAELETGRTHQIRAHLHWRGLPLVGDGKYGGRVRLPPAAGAKLTDALRAFGRQALHAARLELRHPQSGDACRWRQAMPADMRQLIEALEDDLKAHQSAAKNPPRGCVW